MLWTFKDIFLLDTDYGTSHQSRKTDYLALCCYENIVRQAVVLGAGPVELTKFSFCSLKPMVSKGNRPERSEESDRQERMGKEEGEEC